MTHDLSFPKVTASVDGATKFQSCTIFLTLARAAMIPAGPSNAFHCSIANPC